jgi:hypothetical protein
MPLLYASMLDYPISDDVRISSTVMATTGSLFFADGFLQVIRFLYVFGLLH